MIPGMAPEIPSITGGAAQGGTAGNKMGDWSGSAINMGGGSGDTKNLIVIAASIVTLGIVGLIVWVVGRKK